MTGTIKPIRNILLMVIQHGGDDVGCKPIKSGRLQEVVAYGENQQNKHKTELNNYVYKVIALSARIEANRQRYSH